jgi:Spy/CpxP family protein refolding chaperone
MKKNIIIITVVLLTIINLASLATFTYYRWFYTPFPPIMERAEISFHFIKNRLNLDDSQAGQLKSSFKIFQQEAEIILDSLQIKRSVFFYELSLEEPDSIKLTMLIKEMSTLQEEIKMKAINNLLRARSFLTPEQQHEFISFFNERMGSMGMKPD